MKKVVIITRGALRHKYFISQFVNSEKIKIERVYQVITDSVASFGSNEQCLKAHHEARIQIEYDYFGSLISGLNDVDIRTISESRFDSGLLLEDLSEEDFDIIVCYGPPLLKGDFIGLYDHRIINVHLGLSPYYRGSATNMWAYIKRDFDLIGATFMYMNEGIDTGEIIHQIRADICLGDNHLTVGNRLIKDMTDVFIDLVVRFDELRMMPQVERRGVLCKRKDFNEDACSELYNSSLKKEFFQYLKSDAIKRDIIENPAIHKG
jgi:phosphoribosylglycinamide formyltransferase 1